MTSRTNHWKLGLFVLLGSVLVVAALLWLGAQRLGRDTERWNFFFDEAVTGLEVGSPVRFRGVSIGTVASIGIGPDLRAVHVTAEIDRAVVLRLTAAGLAPELSPADRLEQAVREGLRAQIALVGVTGNRYVQIDYHDRAAVREPAFAFAVPANTFPTISSTAKSVEDLLLDVAQTFPELLRQVSALAEEMRNLASMLEPGEVQRDLRALVQSLRRQVEALDLEQLSRGGLSSLERLDALLETADTAVARLLAEADVAATSGALRDAAAAVTRLAAQGEDVLTDAGALSPEAVRVADALHTTLESLQRTLSAVRELAELLERDPGSLLRGREQLSPADRSLR